MDIQINTDDISEANSVSFELIITSGNIELLRSPQVIFFYDDPTINEIGVKSQITFIAQNVHNELLDLVFESDPSIKDDPEKLSKIVSKLATIYYVIIEQLYYKIFGEHKQENVSESKQLPNIGSILLGQKVVDTNIGQVDDEYNEEPQEYPEYKEENNIEANENEGNVPENTNGININELLKGSDANIGDINISIQKLREKLQNK